MTVVICWPADPDIRKVYERIIRQGPLPLYPDSVIMQCDECKTRVLVPPRSKAMVDLGAELRCGLCAALGGVPPDVMVDLGNPDNLNKEV